MVSWLFWNKKGKKSMESVKKPKNLINLKGNSTP